MSIINTEQSNGGIFSVEDAASPVTQACVKLTKNQTKPELTSTGSLFPLRCTHHLPTPYMEGLLSQPLKSLPMLLPLPRTSITVPAVPGHMPLLLDTLSSHPQLRPVTSPSFLTSSSDEGNNNLRYPRVWNPSVEEGVVQGHCVGSEYLGGCRC